MFTHIRKLFAGQSDKTVPHGLYNLDKHSTLVDTVEGRDWRIWGDFADLLIRRVRKLYSNQLSNTVYVLDAYQVYSMPTDRSAGVSASKTRNPIPRGWH